MRQGRFVFKADFTALGMNDGKVRRAQIRNLEMSLYLQLRKEQNKTKLDNTTLVPRVIAVSKGLRRNDTTVVDLVLVEPFEEDFQVLGEL